MKRAGWASSAGQGMQSISSRYAPKSYVTLLISDGSQPLFHQPQHSPLLTYGNRAGAMASITPESGHLHTHGEGGAAVGHTEKASVVGRDTDAFGQIHHNQFLLAICYLPQLHRGTA
jgi:hypothetical protein